LTLHLGFAVLLPSNVIKLGTFFALLPSNVVKLSTFFALLGSNVTKLSTFFALLGSNVIKLSTFFALLPSNVVKLISPLVEGIPNTPSYRVGGVKTRDKFLWKMPKMKTAIEDCEA